MPKITAVPAQGASAPHKATVENGSRATAAVRQSRSDTGQGSLGRGDQQPQGSTQRWPERVGEAARAGGPAEARAMFLKRKTLH